MTSATLRSAREALVRAHVAAEAGGDWAAALATFHRPRYEIVATGETHDGVEAVRRFYAETATAFPSIAFETWALHHGDDAVVAEVVFVARHDGAWRGLPATGRTVRYGMSNVFVFEEDRLVCERMYFDLTTPLRQIGIARDPTSLAGRVEAVVMHPITVLSAVARAAVRGR